MSKKNIGKILEKGSAKQRMILLSNHVAETATDKPGFLSPVEFDTLVESFKTPAEIKLYRRYKEANKALQALLPYLSQLRLLYNIEIAKIEGLCLLHFTYGETQELVNRTLSSIKDETQRAELLEAFIQNSSFLFANPKKDIERHGEGEEQELTEWYELSITEPRRRKFETGGEDITFTMMALGRKNRAMSLLSRIKTLLKALRDYIEENDFRIETYTDFIDTIEKEVTKEDPIFQRYSKKAFLKSAETEEEKEKLLGIFGDTFFMPDYDEAVINQKEYDKYRSSYL